MTIRVPLHGIKLVNFSGIFKSHIEADLINQLDGFKLISDASINIRKVHVKRLMYHHIIKGLCDYVLSAKGKDKIVIVYSSIDDITGDLSSLTVESEFRSFIDKLIIKISRMLPIKFMHVDKQWKEIKSIMCKGNGDSADIINSAKSIIDNFDISSYTFTKARYFAKRYGLVYLSNNFFQQIKNKQLIMC